MTNEKRMKYAKNLLGPYILFIKVWQSFTCYHSKFSGLNFMMNPKFAA